MSKEGLHISGEVYQKLKEQYNYEGTDLRKAQVRMTEMLSFLNDICQKHNITYFIAFGTLLGAVRHGGFIPWDDDLDVYIDSKSLKKLREIINNGNYPYIVQDFTNDNGFVRYYNVLRDLKSEYIKDEFQHNQRHYRGVQIDLFPYDYGVIDLGVKFIGKTYGLNEKVFLGKNKLMTGLVFHLSRDILIPMLKMVSKLKGKKNLSLGYETGDVGYNYLTSDIFPLKVIEFEGLSVPCPNNPVAVLSTDYGPNYMDLPDEKERNQHKVLDIRFYEDSRDSKLNID